ncbi:SPOR domain-containing protein [Crocinitomicaceae bacterium]|nr:SPOR domain-containing protein [Crocinitomicaceae bacterium]
MIQYVEKLFQETKTIILPGLGALTITNPDTKEMMFMPYLKHDDGALAGFIVKEVGISEDEAKKMVADEVHRMLNEIESGKSVPFGNFGSFQKDTDGDVIFENSEGATSSNEPVTAPVADIGIYVEATKKFEDEANKAKEAEAKKKDKEEAEATKAKEAEAKKKAKEEAAAKAAETKKTAPKVAVVPPKVDTPKEEKQKETPKPEDTAAKATVNQIVPDLDPLKDAPKKEEARKVAPIAATSATSANKTSEKTILEKEEIAANQKKLDDLKKGKEEPKKKRKRGAGFYILLSLIFIIVAGGTLVALNYEQAKEYLPFLADSTAAEASEDDENDMLSKPDEEPADDQESEDTTTDEEEDLPVDEEEEITPVEIPEDPKPEPTPPVTGSNDQPYHIVAGVFSESANAEKLATKIQGMGYPAKTIQRGAQTVVSVQSYASAAEAQAAISSVSDAAPKGWVLYWP